MKAKAHNWGNSLPTEINVGFALVSQGYDGKEGYLKIQGLEGHNFCHFGYEKELS